MTDILTEYEGVLKGFLLRNGVDSEKEFDDSAQIARAFYENKLPSNSDLDWTPRQPVSIDRIRVFIDPQQKITAQVFANGRLDRGRTLDLNAKMTMIDVIFHHKNRQT